MFVDASALCAMLIDEDDARELLGRMQRSPDRIMSPLAVWETVIVVARTLGLTFSEAQSAVEKYLQLVGIRRVAVPGPYG